MSDILSRFTTKASTPPGEAEATPGPDGADENKRVYQALRTDQQNRRTPGKLRIFLSDGDVSLLSYSGLQEVHCTPPSHITLIYGHCWIEMVGRNLLQLADHLQDDRARTITCFNARLHDEPEPGSPVITKITRWVFATPKTDTSSKQLGKATEVGR